MAGLRAAVAAAELGTEVAIVSKPSCASPEIMGFNAPVMPGDSKELYFSDIEQSGYGINDSRLAMVLSEHVLDEVTYLEGLGLEFDRDAEGRYLPIHTLGTAYPRLIKTGVSSGSAEMRILKTRCGELGVKQYAPVDILGLLVSRGPCPRRLRPGPGLRGAAALHSERRCTRHRRLRGHAELFYLPEGPHRRRLRHGL